MARLPDIPQSSWLADQQDLLQRKIQGYFPALEFRTAAIDRESQIPPDYGDQEAIAAEEERIRRLQEEEQRRAEEERVRQAAEMQRQLQAQAEQERQQSLLEQARGVASSLGIPTPEEMTQRFQNLVGTKPGLGDPSTETGAFDPAVQPYQEEQRYEETKPQFPEYDLSGGQGPTSISSPSDVKSLDDFRSYASDLGSSVLGEAGRRLDSTFGHIPEAASRYAEQVSKPYAAAGRAAVEAYEDPGMKMLGTAAAPAHAVKIVSDTMQAYGGEAAFQVAKTLGVETDDAVLRILNVPIVGDVTVTKGDVARTAGGALMDPTTYVPGTDPVTHYAGVGVKKVLGPVARGAGRAIGGSLRYADELAGKVYDDLGDLIRGVPHLEAADNLDLAPAIRANKLPYAESVSEGWRRLFHGGQVGNEAVDPDKFDPQGLFGPAHYATTSPEVAEHYFRLTSPGQEGFGGTIRPTELDDRSVLFNAEKPVPQTDIRKITDAMYRLYGEDPEMVGLLQEMDSLSQAPRDQFPRIDAREFYEQLSRDVTPPEHWKTVEEYGGIPTEVGDKRLVNQILSEAGFDGVYYRGERIGDSNGIPIQHSAVAIFPEKLDALRNAFTGEEGGIRQAVRTTAEPREIGDAERFSARSLPARSALGAVTGAVTGAAAGNEDTTAAERMRNAAIGATVGGAGLRYGTRAAARLVDSLVRKGVLDEMVVSSHPADADRIRALFALVARNLPDDAPVEIPGGVKLITRQNPEVRAQVANLIDGPKTAGEVRAILSREMQPETLGQKAQEIMTDLLAGVGGRRRRAAEYAADRASIEGLGRTPTRPWKVEEPQYPGGRVITSMGEAVPLTDEAAVAQVHQIADELGVRRPAVFTVDTPVVQAVAHRASENSRPMLFITKGMLEAPLDADEARYVIAHELAHTTEKSFGEELLDRVQETAGRIFRGSDSPDQAAATLPSQATWQARREQGATVPDTAPDWLKKNIQLTYDEAMRLLSKADTAQGQKRQDFIKRAQQSWKKYEGWQARVEGASRETGSRSPSPGAREAVPVVDDLEAGPTRSERSDMVRSEDGGTAPRDVADVAPSRDSAVVRPEEDLPVRGSDSAASVDATGTGGLEFEPEPLPVALDPQARVSLEDAQRLIPQLQQELVMNPALQEKALASAAKLVGMPKIRGRHVEQLLQWVGERQGVARGMSKEDAGKQWADRFLQKHGWTAPEGASGLRSNVGDEARAAVPEASASALRPTEERVPPGVSSAVTSEVVKPWIAVDDTGEIIARFQNESEAARFAEGNRKVAGYGRDENLMSADEAGQYKAQVEEGNLPAEAEVYDGVHAWGENRYGKWEVVPQRGDADARPIRFDTEDEARSFASTYSETWPKRPMTVRPRGGEVIEGRVVRSREGPSDDALRALEQSGEIPTEIPIEDFTDADLPGAFRRRIDPAVNPPSTTTDPRYQSRNQATAPRPVTNPGLLERIYNYWAPKMTDSVARLQGYQNDIAREFYKQTGYRLPPEAMAAELKRLDPNRAAEMMVDDYLKPAVQTFRELGLSDETVNTYLSYMHDLDVIAEKNNPARLLPDGATMMDAANFVHNMDAQWAAKFTPAQKYKLDAAFRSVWDLGDEVLALKRDAGFITDQVYQDLRASYPHYMPTKILDFINDESHVGIGQSLSVTSNTLHEISRSGTERTALDVLPALYGAVYEAHAAANKNRVFNAFIDMWHAARHIPSVASHATPTSGTERRAQEFADFILTKPPATKRANEFTQVEGFENGVKQRYWVHKDLGDVTKYDSPTIIPVFSGLTAAFRAGATARNPIFLTANMMLDLSTYLIRETSRAGGPQHLPDVARVYGQVLGEFLLPGRSDATIAGMLAGVAGGAMTGDPEDTWGERILRAVEGGAVGALTARTASGIATGQMKQLAGDIARHEYRGDMKRFLVGGGGSAGHSSMQALKPKPINLQAGKVDADAIMKNLGYRQQSELEAGVDKLGRGLLEINTPADLLRIVKDTVLLKPVETLGERIEMIPRVAAMRLAEGRGAPLVEAINAGRTTTIDFNKGGSWARTINQFIPFFNVGVQAIADVGRAYTENPKPFIASVATGVVTPMIIAEAWNQADPQRKKDYDDVPSYIKDQGLVMMLPSDAPVDDKGNRHPQFLHFRYRQLAPIAMLTREFLQNAYYKNVPDEIKRNALEVMLSGISQMSPVAASDPADFASAMMPIGASTVLQASPGVDRDFFRQARIRSKEADERASPLSKGIAKAAEPFVPREWARPSVAEFMSRDLGAGYAGMLHGASEILAGKEAKTAQEIPVVGGLYSRVVKGSIGERANQARENTITDSADKLLADAGISWRPAASSPEVLNIPLTREEYATYQNLMNKGTDEAIQLMAREPAWQKLSTEDKEKAVRLTVDKYRDFYRKQFLGTIPREDLVKRYEKSVAPAGSK